MKRFCVAAMLGLALGAVSFADKVTLKDGRAYEGVVLEETETTVKIKTARATLTLQKDQVVSIEKAAGGGALQVRETRLGALDPEKPQDYLDLAKWMTGPGAEAFDLPTLRHLCAAASKLDAKLAPEAQILLGRKLEESGARREAATAYARALLASPGNAEATKLLDGLKKGLHDDAIKEMEQLCAALDLAMSGNFPEALPRLQKCGDLAMADRAEEHIGMTIEELTRSVSSRVQCKACGGSGEMNCMMCEGDGLITCSSCGGSGNKKGFVAGKDKGGLSSIVCRSCHGCGTILCTKCKAERDIVIRFTWDKGICRDAAVVHAKAGMEAEALKTEIELNGYTQKDEGWYVVSIQGDVPTAGGHSTCLACAGVKYDPPKGGLPVAAIDRYMQEIRARIDGKRPFDDLPAVREGFDASVLTDGLKYRGGKWVK